MLRRTGLSDEGLQQEQRCFYDSFVIDGRSAVGVLLRDGLDACDGLPLLGRIAALVKGVCGLAPVAGTGPVFVFRAARPAARLRQFGNVGVADDVGCWSSSLRVKAGWQYGRREWLPAAEA